MAALPRLLLSLLLVASFCLLVFGGSPQPRRRITKTLYLTNGLDWGKWGGVEYCEDGSFVQYIEAKFEAYGVLNVDETALNGMVMYCIDKDTGLPTGHISSTVGDNGDWQGMQVCPNGFITAVRARVLPSQGTFGDDVAIQNFQLECNHSTTILTAVEGQKELDSKIDLGEWGDWSACPDDSAICGVDMEFNESDALVDDAATSDAIFYCCAIDG